MKKRMSLLSLIALTTLTACASNQVALQKTFWESKTPRIGVAMTLPPKAEAFRVGSQGLLDMAINSVMASPLEEFLQQFQAPEFDVVRDRFAERLQQEGYTVVKIGEPISLKPTDKSSDEEWLAKEYQRVAEKEHVDMILILSMAQLGTLREYYGFIPLGWPRGFAVADGRLIDVRNKNAVLWRSTQPSNKATIEVSGEWDTPPQFDSLTKAIRTAVDQSKTYIENEFFVVNAKH